jgi:transketolase
MDKLELQKKAVSVRKGIVTAVHAAKAGHPGGSLSAADIFTYLYFKEMNIDPKNPKDPDRDRFVLSKGHTAPGLYSAMANRGYFPVEDLPTLRHLGSYLQGHPCMQEVPGTDMSSGSLGQGIAVANGMALAGKRDGKKYRTFVIVGDGECQEGQVWEAAEIAAKYELENLIVFVDNNGLQIDGKVDDVMSLGDIEAKTKAFGWETVVIDGHNFDEIEGAVEKFKANQGSGKPFFVIAKTHKGKGVSFMTDDPSWHGCAPKEEQYNIAVEELDAKIKELEG